MRKEFEMTGEQLATLLDASKPVRYMVFGGVPPASPASPLSNVIRAWATLGQEMGFWHRSVKPVSGKGERFFTAESKGCPDCGASCPQDNATNCGTCCEELERVRAL